MAQSGADQASSSSSPVPTQRIGLFCCLRYGALVGLVFGIACGCTLAVRRITDFPDDIMRRCFLRGFFGGAELGILLGLVVAGIISGLERWSRRFKASAMAAGGVIGLLIGGAVAALLLMDLSTLKTYWDETVPYTDSVINTVTVYTLMMMVGAFNGAVFGYSLAHVIRYRQTFPRNIYVGIPLIAATGTFCGLCVIFVASILTYLEPVFALCHNVL